MCILLLAGCDMAVNKPLFEATPLPFAKTALEPHMSAETLQLHYGRHYIGYVEASNRLTRQPRFRGKSPEAVLQQTYGNAKDLEVFNQVGQAWNHAFFWQSLKPGGGTPPQGRLGELIARDFGSYDQFKADFKAAARGLFGSGWVWLVEDGEGLKIVSTTNADTPIVHGMRPLWGGDVWEHAYYLDYRNLRTDYVTAILEHLANWEFAALQLEGSVPVEAAPRHP